VKDKEDAHLQNDELRLHIIKSWETSNDKGIKPIFLYNKILEKATS